MAEDAEQAMRHFVRAGPLESDADGLERRLFGGWRLGAGSVDLGCVVVFVVRGQSADQRHQPGTRRWWQRGHPVEAGQ